MFKYLCKRVCKYVAASLLISCAAVASDDLQLKGYYKNLFAVSRTIIPAQEDFKLDLNRLRLELRGRPVAWLDYELQYDNEALLGSYLRTMQFKQQDSLPSTTYLDLDKTYVERDSLHMRHRLYRAFASVDLASTKITLGRQRIAWGSGRLWNPTDLLNPYSPTQLELQERTGVDAVLVDHSVGALTHISAVYAPQHDAASSYAARFATNLNQTDVAAMVGKFRGQTVFGGEFAGRIGESGIHGEIARTQSAADSIDEGSYTRLVIGADYAFANTLILGGELYWNGQGSSKRRDYNWTGLSVEKIQNLARRYLGAQARYDITPLLHSDNVLIVNADDSSYFVSSSLLYSVIANLDLIIGLQLFQGASDSEYGRQSNIYFAGVQCYF